MIQLLYSVLQFRGFPSSSSSQTTRFGSTFFSISPSPFLSFGKAFSSSVVGAVMAGLCPSVTWVRLDSEVLARSSIVELERLDVDNET